MSIIESDRLLTNRDRIYNIPLPAIALLPLPDIQNLIGAWIFAENQEGYVDGESMPFVPGRIGGFDLIGGPIPPTYNALNKTAVFDSTQPNYFRAPFTFDHPDWQFVADGAQFTIHDVHLFTDVPGTFETLASTATNSSEVGARLFRTGTQRRVDIYPDNILETGGAYTDLTTQFIVRSFAWHSDINLDPSLARYLYHQNGVNVGSDASSRFAGNSPMSNDLFYGVLQNLALPGDYQSKCRFVQAHFDGDASQCGIVQDWADRFL
jgi:hypothetical protein